MKLIQPAPKNPILLPDQLVAGRVYKTRENSRIFLLVKVPTNRAVWLADLVTGELIGATGSSWTFIEIEAEVHVL